MSATKLLLFLYFVQLCESDFSNTWLIRGDFSLERIKNISSKLGFVYVSELPTGHVLLSRNDVQRSSKHKSALHTKRLLSFPEISFAKQEQWIQVNRRQTTLVPTPNDPMWNLQWYMNDQKSNTMGILQAWLAGFDGTGVNIAIVDDGVDYTHRDLSERYKEGRDVYDFDDNPLPSTSFNHGTKCAGVALATAYNGVCVAGVAHRANLIGIRMIGPRGVLPSGQIEGLTNKAVHISSNSWGGLDHTFDGPSQGVKDALKYGVTNLRNRKGVIYLFAGGNGAFDDNCNTDGYVNSIYTIGINSVAIDYDYPGYAEPCTAVLASAFSGNGVSNVCSTDVGQGCVSDFSGTSAATPMAAGVLALLLQANPNLTWRDVQELIVKTSRTDVFTYGQFKTNGVGRKVSDWFGYGLLDLQNMLSMAKNWTSLPNQHTCTSRFISLNLNIAKGDRLKRTIESSFKTDGCNDTAHCVNSIEHVEVQVIFEYSVRGVVELTLQAPSGTVSNLLTARNSDNDKNGRLDWTYMSVHHWGENPIGIWKLNMSINSNINEGGNLVGWKLILYGTGQGCSTNVSDTESGTDETGESKKCVICAILVPVLLIVVIIIIIVVFLVIKKTKKSDIQDSNIPALKERPYYINSSDKITNSKFHNTGNDDVFTMNGLTVNESQKNTAVINNGFLSAPEHNTL